MTLFQLVVCGLVEHCQTFVGKHIGSSKWHPLLGWYQDGVATR